MRVSCVIMAWEGEGLENFPGRGSSQYRSPQVEACLAYSGNSKERCGRRGVYEGKVKGIEVRRAAAGLACVETAG